MENILRLVFSLIVFVLVLFVTYYATRWIAKSGAIQPNTKNIKVVETFKIAPNKYVQIIQIGSKFYSIGITKDNISFLSELEEEQLDLQPEQASAMQEPFKAVWDKVSDAVKDKTKKQ